jgi:beta-lactamase class A
VLAAAAVLRREGVAGLGRRVTYPQADVVSYAPVTAAHVAAVPGDPRDTTTPRALADDLQALTVGTALSAAARTQLVAWLDSCTTGPDKIRAAVPAGWAVGDKTGSGSYGTSNDLALLRPPGRAPIVVTVLSTDLATADAAAPPDLLARAARVALTALGESPVA